MTTIAGREAVTHELKTWPEYFAKILDGSKRFELRNSDRDFRVGDLLRLREWRLTDNEYTGREITVRVTYLTTDTNWMNGYSVAMSIEPVADKPTPAEPHADAGKMVAVGEGRELPDKPGIWFRVGSDQAWLVQQDNDGSLCARAINVANLKESIGPHNDIHFQLSRGNWHPTTTTETERLRVAMCIYCGHGIPVDAADVKASHEILKAHDASCPANPLAKELTTLREQLAAAERERDEALAECGRRNHGASGLCCQLRLLEKGRAEAAEAENTRLQAELAAAGAKGGE